MANTYELINSTTVGAGGTANITFSSIPSTYTDLKVVMSTRVAATGGDWIDINLNADSSVGNYFARWVGGSGTAASASNNNIEVAVWNPSDATASTFASAEIYLANYSGSNVKPYFSNSTTENNGTAAYSHFVGSVWNTSTAINSIKLIARGTTFVQYSTFWLYGIKNS